MSHALPDAPPNGVGRRAGDLFVVALSMGLTAGFVEPIRWLSKTLLYDSLICLHPGYWWMSPLLFVGVMGCGALLLAIVAWLRPRWDVVSFAVAAFAFLAWANLLLLIGSIHDLALVVAAGGLAVATGRLFLRYRERSLAIMRWTGVPAALLLTSAAVGHLFVGQWHPPAESLPAPPAGAPNVLLIVLDAVRADALEVYGADREVAPNIARLAAQGTTFDNAWATAPWTLPSHAAMFTGRLPSELSADWLQPLDDAPPTLAEALAARGWITGGFVGNTRYCSAETGLARGFSHYEDYRLTAGEVALCTAIGRKCLLSALAGDCGVVDWPARKKAAEVSGGFGQWLRQRQGRPYFAFLNFYDAHDPYIAPPGYRTRVPASRDDAHLLTHWWCAPKYNLGEAQLELLKRSYEDCIRGLDAHLGNMLDQLRQRGELDNTIIIITADHGEHFGDHNLYLHGNSLYEPLLRVPLIVVWPGKIPANVRVKTPVSLAGLPNTLLELTGEQRRFPGGSFAQLLKSGPRSSVAAQDADIVAAELPSQAAHPPCHGHSPVAHGAMQCLRSGSLKYIRWGKFEELYDLERDPQELEDLTQRPDYAGELARLRAEWQRRYAQRPATDRPDADHYAAAP